MQATPLSLNNHMLDDRVRNLHRCRNWGGRSGPFGHSLSVAIRRKIRRTQQNLQFCHSLAKRGRISSQSSSPKPPCSPQRKEAPAPSSERNAASMSVNQVSAIKTVQDKATRLKKQAKGDCSSGWGGTFFQTGYTSRLVPILGP